MFVLQTNLTFTDLQKLRSAKKNPLRGKNIKLSRNFADFEIFRVYFAVIIEKNAPKARTFCEVKKTF